MNRNIIFLIIVGTLTLLAGGVYGYLYNYIRTTSARVAELNLELQTQKQQAQGLEHLKDLAGQATISRDKLMKYIVPGNNSADAIAFVESLARETGATSTLSSVNVVPNDMLPLGTEYFEVSLSFSGTWKQVISFEKTLETMPYKAIVNSLELNSGRTGGSSRDWNANYKFSLVKEKESEKKTDTKPANNSSAAPVAPAGNGSVEVGS